MPYKNEKASQTNMSSIINDVIVHNGLNNLKPFELDKDLLPKNIKFNKINYDESNKYNQIFAVDGSISFVDKKIEYLNSKFFFIRCGGVLLDMEEIRTLEELDVLDPRIFNKLFMNCYHFSAMFPLSNLLHKDEKTVFNSFRRIFYENMLDRENNYKEDLFNIFKFLVYEQYNEEFIKNPKNVDFHCPVCTVRNNRNNNKPTTVCFKPEKNEFDEYVYPDITQCSNPKCKVDVYITDFVGFYSEIYEFDRTIKENIALNFMALHETLSILLVMKQIKGRDELKSLLFIKDGRLALDSYNSRFSSKIREFLYYLYQDDVSFIGHEKTGNIVEFFEDLNIPKDSYCIIDTKFATQYFGYNSPFKYGHRTFYGVKIVCNINGTHTLVLSLAKPNKDGIYDEKLSKNDIIKLMSIFTCLRELLSNKYHNSLYPISIINDKVSLSIKNKNKISDLISIFNIDK